MRARERARASLASLELSGTAPPHPARCTSAAGWPHTSLAPRAGRARRRSRYATDSVTSYIVRELGRRAGTPVQEFVVKNDCPCGSTIGPILSSALGVRACDIGMPQLSMHSVREMMGVDDLTHCYALMAEFFKNFGAVDKAIASCAPCAER